MARGERATAGPFGVQNQDKREGQGLRGQERFMPLRGSRKTRPSLWSRIYLYTLKQPTNLTSLVLIIYFPSYVNSCEENASFLASRMQGSLCQLFLFVDQSPGLEVVG